MSSVQRVISLNTANVKQLKETSDTPASQVPVSTPQQGDTFTPSFKGKVASKSGFKKAMLPYIASAQMFFAEAMAGARNVFHDPKKAMVLGAGVTAVGMGMTSCEKDPFAANPYIVVNEGGVTVNVDIQIDTSMIASLLQALATQNAAQWQALLQQIAEMNNANAVTNDLLRQVITLLVQNGAQLDQIIAMLGAGFEQLAGDNQELRDILTDIRLLVSQNNNLTAEQNQLITSFISLVTSMRAENNEDNAAIINLIETLIDKVGQMDNNVAQNFAAVMQRLDAMHNSQSQADQNRANEAAEILLAIQNLTLEVQSGIAATIAHIDALDANQADRYLDWLNTYNTMSSQLRNKLNQIYDAIGDMDSTQQAAYTQIIAKMGNIIDKLEQGNLSINEIKALLQEDPGVSPSVDLSVTNALLAQILARENANGDMLNDINNNTQLVTAAVNNVKARVNALYNSVNAMSAQQHADLMAILNRIPTDIQSCDCDCERIIELLEEITDDLSNDNYNHEGYNEDYGDILG